MLVAKLRRIHGNGCPRAVRFQLQAVGGVLLHLEQVVAQLHTVAVDIALQVSHAHQVIKEYAPIFNVFFLNYLFKRLFTLFTFHTFQ